MFNFSGDRAFLLFFLRQSLGTILVSPDFASFFRQHHPRGSEMIFHFSILIVQNSNALGLSPTLFLLDHLSP